MKLHANAPLGPKGRLTMVLRVLERGWSLTEAAEAAGVSERTCAQVGRALPGRGRGRAAGPLLGAAVGPAPHPSERVEAIVALRRLRMTGAEIADVSGDGALDGLGGAAAGRAGQAPPAGAARAAQPLRAPPGRRADPHRRQEARAHPRRGRAPRDRQRRASRRSTDADGHGATTGWEFVHVCVDDATRLAYVEVLADEKATTAVGVPAPRASPSTAPRHQRRARDDRQRRAPTAPPSTPSPAARWASATSAPAPTGRAPTARPSASSAPCSAAGPTARSTATATNAPPRLPGWLDFYNSPPTPRLPQPQAAHRSPRRAEQPGWVLHLVPARVARRRPVAVAGRSPTVVRARQRGSAAAVSSAHATASR